jgi:hypothetical protein
MRTGRFDCVGLLKLTGIYFPGRDQRHYEVQLGLTPVASRCSLAHTAAASVTL